MKLRGSIFFMMVLILMVMASVSAATGAKVQFYNSNLSSSTNTLALNFNLVNTGTDPITLSNAKIRYYFTNDGAQSNSFACDWATAGSSNVTGTFAMITAVTGADRYLEVGFTSSAGSLAAGASSQIQIRVWKSDWSNFTQTNDYSFNSTATSYADWSKVALYINGTLYWGTPVSGGTPVPTVPGTATATPAVTRTPTPQGATPTPTPASTSSPISVYKFDFGGGSIQSGYTKVSASLAYSASRGYGFNTPSNMKNVTSSGTGINTDAVQFLVVGTTSNNTFNVDLPNGLYQIKVILGNCSRSSVAAEGVYQIMNMTGNNAVDTIQIPITDGQLNILITDGKAGTTHTLSALEITRISTSPVMNKTIWIGGDSTVCNYYPLNNTNNSVQTGWGQMLSSYISSSRYQIRNMATGGQYARGFFNDGQFTAIMKYLKAGDIFILQFGINDVSSTNAETADEFTSIMGSMVNQAKATGATVVLNTPQGRATNWSGNVHTCLNSSYRPQTVALATAKNVPLCDLNVLSSAYYTSIGQTATYALYMADNLHLNRAGALQLARVEYEELTRQNLLK